MSRPLRAILLASALTPFVAHAQVKLGVVVAGVSSTISVKPEGDLPNKESRLGYAAGVSLSVRVASAIQFAPELLYMVKGVKAKVTNSQGSGAAEIKLTSIEVPLLLRWSPTGAARITPTIIAGPSVSFNQQCTNHIVVTVGTTTSSQQQSCGDEDNEGTTSIDYGAMVGAGVTMSRLSLTLRYDLGLKNIQQNPQAGEVVKNRAIMLALGISM